MKTITARMTIVALLLVSVFAFSSCKNDDQVEDEILLINGVAVNIGNAELTIGDTLSLSATVLPYNQSPKEMNWVENTVIEWRSDNPDVATVSQDGLITAIGKGTCNVYFVIGIYAAKCQVTVRSFHTELFYGKWKEATNLSFYNFNVNGTGDYGDKAFNWSFDGMRLKLEFGKDEVKTYIVTYTAPGEIVFYDSNDESKKAVRLLLQPREFTVEELFSGVTQIKGKDDLLFDAVDLGLPDGVLWGINNLRTNSPEEVGLFYAWGEVETKDEFNLHNYSFYDTELLELTKYNESDSNLQDVVTLSSEDDAANLYMGGDWRIPTREDVQVLCDNCNAIWATLNGTEGLLFISKVKGFEGNSIFLPFTGFPQDMGDLGFYGNYWTSTLTNDDCFSAYNLYMYNIPRDREYDVFYDKSKCKRYHPACIRPVVNK